MSIELISSNDDYPRKPFGPADGSPAEDDPRRCTANLSDGSGERCKRWAMVGMRVCPMHGGKVPTAKRRAQLTLMDLLPLATRKHREILETSQDERVVLQATKMVYDRTGLEEGSHAGDQSVVREMIMSRLIDSLGGLPEAEPLPEDEDIVDAELVEDDELADLL